MPADTVDGGDPVPTGTWGRGIEPPFISDDDDSGDEMAYGVAAAIREAAPPDVATFRRWLLAGKDAESG